MTDAPVLYYELQSPYSWLAAERITRLIPAADWKPVSYAHVVQHTGVLPWSFNEERSEDFAEIERRANERGLLDVRYPEGWPMYSTIQALRAATFAKEIGKVQAFSLAAFRQQFNGGRPLSDIDTILLAAAACEIHPDALLKNIERDAIKERLKQTTQEAIDRGVTGVPTVAIDGELFWGDDRLEAATAALAH